MATEHFEAIWRTFLQLVKNNREGEQLSRARELANLPARLGGLGLTSTTLTAPAVFGEHWLTSFLC